MPELLLALDAGTTSLRAMVATAAGEVLAVERRGLVSTHPAPGLVEQDAGELWTRAREVIAAALSRAGRSASDLAAIGVTTQRASVVVWDADTGEPVSPMVIWSDLRGLERSRSLREAGFTAWPQTPACKLEAILAEVPGPRQRLRWGTLDSYLVSRLTRGAAHVTDLSNAWLTGYLDVATTTGWNTRLVEHQGLSPSMFPTLTETYGDLARTAPKMLGAAVPITAIVADQQSGMFAHDALLAGKWKATYGTSGVVMMSTGAAPATPSPSMPPLALSRAAGRTDFAFEGMVVTAGAFLDWMWRDLGLFASAAALDEAAASVMDAGGAAIRPSLQGLGAPHARFDAAGLFAGLRPGVRPPHLARAALEAIAYRVREVADAIETGGIALPARLPVDGGLTAGELLLQLQADTLGRPVQRHAVRDGTAYGAIVAAALGAGLADRSDLARFARYDCTFEPRISRDQADSGFAAWREDTRL